MVDRRISLLLAISFLLCIPSLVMADTVTYILNDTTGDVLDDAYVSDAFPTTNYGNSVLVFGSRSYQTTETYIKFDLTSQVSGGYVSYALLTVGERTCSVNNIYYRNVTVHAVSDDGWDESTITWNSKPSYNATPDKLGYAYYNNANLFQDVNWVITEMVAREYAGDGTLSLVVRFDASYGAEECHESTESAQTDLQLLINVTDGTPGGGGAPGGGYGEGGFSPADPPDIPVGAIPISDCSFIMNTSGTPSSPQWYYLTQNLAGDIDDAVNYTQGRITGCIDVNDSVSNWVLSLNGYKITDDVAGIPAGIYFNGDNDGWSIGYGEIEGWTLGNCEDAGAMAGAITGSTNITDGAIEYIVFDQNPTDIKFSYDVHDISITNNIFTGTGDGAICIASSGGAPYIATGFEISNNDLTLASKFYGIYGEYLQDSLIVSNELGNFTGYDECCTTEVAWFLGLPYEDTTCLEYCSGTSTRSNFGLYLLNSSENQIAVNTILAHIDSMLNGVSYNNTYAYNTFVKLPSDTANGLYLNSLTYDNFGCSNEGFVFDSGTDNVFQSFCPSDITGGITCTPGWFCTDVDYVGYLRTDCTFSNTSYCAGGCVSDSNASYCAGSSPGGGDIADEVDITDYIYDVNVTAFEEGGIDWLLPFLSKFAVYTAIMVLASAGVSKYIGQDSAKAVFPSMITLISLGYTAMGIYPLVVGLLIVIVSGYIALKFLGEMFGIGG